MIFPSSEGVRRVRGTAVRGRAQVVHRFKLKLISG